LALAVAALLDVTGRWGALVLTLWLVFVAAMTVARNELWRDEVAMWLDAVDKAPAKARAWENLGEALGDRHRYGEAERALSESVRLEPTTNALYNLGQLYTITGRPELAKAQYERVLEREPTHVSATVALARIAAAAGQIDEALGRLRRSTLYDKVLELRLEEARILLSSGHDERALPILEKLVKQFPRTPAPHLELARLYQKLGRNDEAQKLYDRAAAMPR
jgi:tetratricopeptide (TPR) repeat protein